MHAKYEVSISYSSKFLAEVKVFLSQTGQKLDAPKFHSGGINNPYEKKLYGTYMSKLYVKYRGHIIVKYMSHICILNVNEVEDI